MKNKPLVRWIVRVRIPMICLVIAAIALIEFQMGESWASRFGQAAASQAAAGQTENFAAPNMGISDLMLAAH